MGSNVLTASSNSLRIGAPLMVQIYVVSSKSAFKSVKEQLVVRVDKGRNIENHANRYATETIGNSVCPLDHFQRVKTIALRTMRIVRTLPKLEVQ